MAPERRSRSTKWAVMATAAAAAGALALVSSVQHSRASVMVSEVTALKALHSSNTLMRQVGSVKVPAVGASSIDTEADALIAAAAAQVEKRALSGMDSAHRIKLADKQHKLQRLADDDGTSDRDPPMFYENYQQGDVGVAGISKWVPEDHPEGHKDCLLHDIDCDELWPWGKVRQTETGPPVRNSPLGDNLIGLDSDDDAVVPTEDSGMPAITSRIRLTFPHHLSCGLIYTIFQGCCLQRTRTSTNLITGPRTRRRTRTCCTARRAT
jgi:hypothetical protein